MDGLWQSKGECVGKKGGWCSILRVFVGKWLGFGSMSPNVPLDCVILGGDFFSHF